MNKLLLETVDRMAEGISYLRNTDADLDRLIAEDGMPPLWNRTPGFPTLVHIILEQQVSLASARAAFERLLNVLPELNPVKFLTLNDEKLRQVGFSRQKTSYVRGLSEALDFGKLSLESLPALDDQEVRRQLMQIKGIGRWTSDIYLLMALGRPDVWPAGDLALIKSIKHVKRFAVKPSPGELDLITNRWQPWRSVAARVLWNHYLLRLNTRPVTNL